MKVSSNEAQPSWYCPWNSGYLCPQRRSKYSPSNMVLQKHMWLAKQRAPVMVQISLSICAFLGDKFPVAKEPISCRELASSSGTPSCAISASSANCFRLNPQRCPVEVTRPYSNRVFHTGEMAACAAGDCGQNHNQLLPQLLPNWMCWRSQIGRARGLRQVLHADHVSLLRVALPLAVQRVSFGESPAYNIPICRIADTWGVV